MNFHGVLFTLWYLVAILQSWLILKNKRVLHRELGIVAALIAISAFILTYVAKHGSLFNGHRWACYGWCAIQYYSDLSIYLLRCRWRLFSSKT